MKARAVRRRMTARLLGIGTVIGMLVTILLVTGCPNPFSGSDPSTDEVERDLDRPEAELEDIADPIVGGPYDTQPSWTWESDPDEGTTVFRYRLNSGEWTVLPAAPPPYEYTPPEPLYPGTYVFEVQERNVAGIWSESCSHTTTILVMPPAFSATPPAITNTTTPSFSWEQGTPLQYGATNRFSWRLERREDGEWVIVTAQTASDRQDVTGYTVSEAQPDGAYRFGVAERNEGGARSEFIYFVFTLDATPPAAPVVSGPSAVSEADPWSTYTWSYDTSDSFGSFSWELRNAANEIVNSDTGIAIAQASVPSAGVTPPAGTYTLRVRHEDLAGNVSAAGLHTIEIEATSGLSYPAGHTPTNNTQPTLQVTGLDQAGLTGEFRWVINDVPEASTFNAPGGIGESFQFQTPELTQGTHEIRVQQRRSDGSYADPSSPVIIEIDLTPPPAPGVPGDDATVDTSPSYTVTGEAGGTFIYTVSGATTIGATEVPDAGSNGTEVITLSGLNVGVNTVHVRVRDYAGNEGPESTFNVTILDVYTVSYNANGATGGSAPADQQKIEGIDLTLATNSGGLVRTGYVFNDWNTAPDGSGADYPEGGTYGTDANLALYANWSPNEYTVTFEKADGTGGTNSVIVTYDAAMPAATAPTRTGYSFGGYYTGVGGTGTQYYTVAMASARNWDLTANTILYAQWIANTYTVTFNKDGGSGGTDSVVATYGSPMPAVLAPTKDDNVFDGYYTVLDGGGIKYYTAAMTSVRNWDIAAPTTLYANWRPLYLIGDFGPAGGIVFYDKGFYSDNWRYLEAAPSDQSTGAQWGDQYSINGTSVTIGSGEANTAAIVNELGTGDYAAYICNQLVLGGYTDWFLPSGDELALMYQNLHYEGIGGFEDAYYWSSYEVSATNARLHSFTDGDPYNNLKSAQYRVRAARAF